VKTVFHTYQLNLVLDDANQPRLNLSNHSDRDWTWETGQELAEFLEVPFLDQVVPKEQGRSPEATDSPVAPVHPGDRNTLGVCLER
jgi:hypothetical protein